MKTTTKKKGHGRPPTNRGKSTINMDGCKEEAIWLDNVYRKRFGKSSLSMVVRRAVLHLYAEEKSGGAKGESGEP